MANNTLALLQAELGDRLNLNYSVSSIQTQLTRWLNLTANDISSRYPWEFLYNNTFIQTVTDYTTGTITGTLGNATITGIGTNWTSSSPNMVGCYIQPTNDTNWYEIQTVNSATSITLTEPLAVAVTGGIYTLRTTYYDLPANCYKVFDVRQTNTPAKLTCLGIYSIDLFQPDINTTSNPTGYFLFGMDPRVSASAAKQEQMAFFPCPDSIYNIQIRYLMETTDLVNQSDVTIIPPRYTGVLLDGAEWLGNKYLNDPGEDACKEKYEFSLQKMIENENANGDYFPILQSSDNMIGQNPWLNMPGNFPSPNSGDY